VGGGTSQGGKGIRINRNKIERMRITKEEKDEIVSLLDSLSTELGVLSKQQREIYEHVESLKNKMKVGGPELHHRQLAKRVVEAAAIYYNIDVEFMKSKTRKEEAVQARKLATYYIREKTPMSFLEIGRYVSTIPNDHATMHTAHKKVQERLDMVHDTGYDGWGLKKGVEEITNYLLEIEGVTA
jgi:chromosomal replication initiation ATPase DnaA